MSDNLRDSHLHGLGATLAAFSLPETLVSVGERWVFAVAVALSTTLLSRIASVVWLKLRGDGK